MKDTRDSQARPPRTAAWLPCALGASFFSYAYFLRVAPSAMIEDLMRAFDVSALALGNLGAAYFYIYACMQLPLGLAIDRLDARRILAWGISLAAGGTLFFALAEGLPAAYASRLMIGAGCATAWLGTLKLAMLYLPVGRYALVVGLTNLVGMAGAMSAQAPLALAVQAFGWRNAMLAAAAVGALLALVFMTMRMPIRTGPTPRSLAVNPWRELLQLLARRQIWLIVLFTVCTASPIISFCVLWAVPYGMAAYGLDRPTAGTLASIGLLGWGIGGPILAPISERLRRRKPILLLGPLGVAASMGLLIWPGMPLAGAYAALLLGGCCTGAVICVFAVAKEVCPPRQGATVTSLLTAGMTVLTAALQVVMGYMLDRFWEGGMANGARLYPAEAYRAGLMLMPCLSLVGLLVLRFVPETYCRQRGE